MANVSKKRGDQEKIKQKKKEIAEMEEMEMENARERRQGEKEWLVERQQ